MRRTRYTHPSNIQQSKPISDRVALCHTICIGEVSASRSRLGMFVVGMTPGIWLHDGGGGGPVSGDLQHHDLCRIEPSAP